MTIEHVATAAVVGAGATAAIDLWNGALRLALGVQSLSYCVLGRWFRHMPGAFMHDNLAAAPRKSHECAVGWFAHYSIGAGLAIVFVALASPAWLASPTLLPALAYGVATVGFPFLIMQPAFGLGVAAARTPHPWQARAKSLGTHIVFGVAVYAVARGLIAVRP